MNKEIVDPKIYRQLGRCFYLVVPLCNNEEEFDCLMQDAQKVEQATKKMLEGSISIEDLLESIEGFVPSIDDYIEEIEENMNECLVKIYRH